MWGLHPPRGQQHPHPLVLCRWYLCCGAAPSLLPSPALPPCSQLPMGQQHPQPQPLHPQPVTACPAPCAAPVAGRRELPLTATAARCGLGLGVSPSSLERRNKEKPLMLQALLPAASSLGQEPGRGSGSQGKTPQDPAGICCPRKPTPPPKAAGTWQSPCLPLGEGNQKCSHPGPQGAAASLPASSLPCSACPHGGEESAQYCL